MPIRSISLMLRGAWMGRGAFQVRPSGEVVRLLVLPSLRHSARCWPWTVRGNRAMPLLRAAGPVSRCAVKVARSGLVSRRGLICSPS